MKGKSLPRTRIQKEIGSIKSSEETSLVMVSAYDKSIKLVMSLYIKVYSFSAVLYLTLGEFMYVVSILLSYSNINGVSATLLAIIFKAACNLCIGLS